VPLLRAAHRSDRPRLPEDELTVPLADLETLRDGEIEILGRMPYSSNATFLITVCRAAGEGAPVQAVYKPARGERPLWDFPSGLYQREAGAYLLSRALGWEVVPPTVVRDGPLGPGSVQAFVDADFEQHYFTLLEDERHHDALRRLCVFDLLANSTDRKGGHVLVDREHHLWAIDNGLSFHAEFKLRTVIWDFAEEHIPRPLIDDVLCLLEGGADAQAAAALTQLDALLDPFERDALRARARAVVADGIFPGDPTGRRWPWPVI
jgi:uncharacterized repeat protein (TIGR03843 family)